MNTMDSRMKKFLNSKYSNSNKSFPANSGQPWTDEEEATLLEELNNQTDMDRIAAAHKRTVGGITSRCKEIAYKMYQKNVPLDEIAILTKLHPECIQQVIDKKQNKEPKENNKEKESPLEKNFHDIKKDLQNITKSLHELINDRQDIKQSLHELTQSFYESKKDLQDIKQRLHELKQND